VNTAWNRFLLALQFLTRLPVTRLVRMHPGDMAGCTVYFPVAGTVIGCAGALMFFVAQSFGPSPLAVLLALVTTVWITGALHEDGLADAADGFGASVERVRALEIMRDSRLGSYGAVALWVSLTGRYVALCTLGTSAGAALVAGATVSRWACLRLMTRASYAGSGDRLSRLLVEAKAGRESIGAHLYTLVVLFLVLRWDAAIVALAAWASVECARAYFMRRLGGVTGDCIGATCQCVEIATYIILACARWTPAPA